MLINVETDLGKINVAADALITAIREKAHINDEIEYKIRLIVKELLTNVLSYSDADRVTINAAVDGAKLILTIEDNGSGFKYAEIMERDVTGDDFLMCEGGRGIFLVRMMSDSVCFNDKGNRVQVGLSLV